MPEDPKKFRFEQIAFARDRWNNVYTGEQLFLVMLMNTKGTRSKRDENAIADLLDAGDNFR